MARPNLSVLCPVCGTVGQPIARALPFCSSRCRQRGARQGIFFPPDIARFDAQIARDGKCLVWRGTLTPKGYGTFYVGRYGVLAHRFAWIRECGTIPEGLDVCHRCDNPPCVAVEHLFLGTHADNMADMARKGRQASGDRNAMRMRPEIRARGERSGRAKLTDASALEILAAYRPRTRGAGCTSLAKRYGVSHETVRALVQRRTWTHLTPPSLLEGGA